VRCGLIISRRTIPHCSTGKASDADAHLKSVASVDLTIALSRVGSFRAGRHGDRHAQTSHVLDCSGGDCLLGCARRQRCNSTDVVLVFVQQTFSAATSTNPFGAGLTAWAVNGRTSTTVKNAQTWSSGNGTISVSNADVMFAGGISNGSGTPTFSSSSVAPNNAQTISAPFAGTVDWAIASNNASFTLNPAVSGGGSNGSLHLRSGRPEESYATTDTANRCLSLAWWRKPLAWWRGPAASPAQEFLSSYPGAA
jgi:hypothetical protein